MRGVNLATATFAGCKLAGSGLTGPRSLASEADGGDWSFANLRMLDLRGARLAGVRLAEADLVGPDLTGADLTDAVGDLDLAMRLAEQRGVLLRPV